MKGTVLSYNRRRGYGFIAEENNDVDWFVHVSGLVNRKSLQTDDVVEFDAAERDGKPIAVNVRVVEAAAPATTGAAR